MQDIEDLHRGACVREEVKYVDPSTGLQVFTGFHLLRRGRCCGCGCRHCPYKQGCAYKDKEWIVLNGDLDEIGEEADLMFFSGGKDSFLALRRMMKEAVREVVLVTTFESGSGIVAHQEVEIDQVKRQAAVLGLVLVGVPIGFGSYVNAVEVMVEKLKDHGVNVKRLVFGDLHLRHIREWRERMLGGLGELHFPLWGADYGELMRELEEEGVVVRISAVEQVEGISVGDVFDRELVEKLPDDVDAFGERGEFHTLVCMWEESIFARRFRKLLP